ncbi:MAG: DUF3185 domain-containing protein [Holophagaceae bacterium]|nr:DUF3185 domain-containing protein [Holophagaceae bacterium]
MKLIGLALVVCGVLILAYGGFSYMRREKVVDIGSLHVTAETRRDVPIAPIAGIAAIVGGIVLVLADAKRGGLKG